MLSDGKKPPRWVEAPTNCLLDELGRVFEIRDLGSGIELVRMPDPPPPDDEDPQPGNA